jgi:hypothetical protein
LPHVLVRQSGIRCRFSGSFAACLSFSIRIKDKENGKAVVRNKLPSLPISLKNNSVTLLQLNLAEAHAKIKGQV